MPDPKPKHSVSDRAHIRGHGWGVVPHWVYDSEELGSSEKLVLAALSRHSGGDGASFPSVARLQGYTGLARRTVQYLLRRLEARGALMAEPQHGDDGRQTSTVYTIMPPPWTPLGEGAKPARGGRKGCAGEGATVAPPHKEVVLTESKGTESGEPRTDGRSLGGPSQELPRARVESVAPVAAGDLAFLTDGRRGVVIPASTAEPVLAVPVPARRSPDGEGGSPVALPHGWPTIRSAAAEAGVSELVARSEALREEVEDHRPAIRVLAELLDMEPRSRERLGLPAIERPDDYLRGWRRRPPPDRTYGDAKRLLAVYGRAESAPDRGPQRVWDLLPQAAAPP